MTTTIRTESDHARPYLHMLVATYGVDEVRHPVILPGHDAIEELRRSVIPPGHDAIERVRAGAENGLTDRTLTDEAFRDAVHTARGELDA